MAGYKLTGLAAAIIAIHFAPNSPLIDGALAAPTEEIVVTTRRTEENLQEVPIAVDVIDANTIQSLGIRGLDGISNLNPSVQFDEGYSKQDVRIAIRGLSNTRGRSNVAFLVDGIDVTSEALGTAGSSLLANQRLLNDIERVEVVKGPQSALYGRAAFAGAISYVTKDSTEELSGNVGLDIGDYGRRELKGNISGPLSDTVGMRLNAVYWESDGYYKNDVSGSNTGGGEGYGLAWTTNWDPTDTFGAKLRMSWTDDDYDISSNAVIYDRTTLPIPDSAHEDVIDPDTGNNLGPVVSPGLTSVDVARSFGSADNKFVASSEDPRTGDEYPGTDLDIFRTSLQLEWDFSGGTLGSYTGYTQANSILFFDSNRQAINRPDEILAQFEVNDKNKTRQFSQELRWSSSLDGPLNYSVGALWWNETRDQEAAGAIVLCINEALCAPDGTWQSIMLSADPQYGDQGIFEAETNHWSLYGRLDWDISDTWSAALEARYVDEKFDLNRTVNDPCFITPPLTNDCGEVVNINGSISSEFVTPKATLEWRPADNAMLYLSAGKGQKPAGIDVLPTGQPFPTITIEDLTFDSEKMWAYEFGAKTNWDGDRLGALLFNTAVFYQDYTDKQTFTTELVNGFISPVVENASSASVFGVELEATWQTALDGLSFSGSYTWLDATYDDFITTTSSPDIIAGQGECVTIVDDGVAKCISDRSGNRLEKSPEHAFVGMADYIAPFFDTGIDWLVGAVYSYQSQRYLASTNVSSVESYSRVNLRAGLENDKWQLIFYVDNLTDADEIITGGSGPEFGQAVIEGLQQGGNFIGVVSQQQPFANLPDPRVYGVRLNYDF